MKKLFQSLNNGKIFCEEVPVPSISEDEILIKTKLSLISTGTEKMLIDFGKSNLIKKAINQPERVKQALNKISTDGIIPTYTSIKSKLNTPLPMGYCNIGIIEKIGKNINNFSIGQRVISNGSHAEYVSVKKNLCALVPDEIDDHDAVFTILGSIALNSIRDAKVSIGETIVVYGLGVLGLLTSQILLANGCNVIGLDIDEEKLKIANQYGIETFNSLEVSSIQNNIKNLTGGFGADAVILTLNSNSNEPLSISCELCRQNARIVLLGIIGNQFDRNLFYKKGLKFNVSMSYGPGRYDEIYENKGIDYPIGYVRWTENRNFYAFLKLLKDKKVSTKELVSNEYNLENYHSAYEEIKNSKKLGIILKYNFNKNSNLSNKISSNKKINFQVENEKIVLDFIGPGNHAKINLLPHLANNKNIVLNDICSKNGDNAKFVGKKFKFCNYLSDSNEIFKSRKSNTIFISSRHDTHFNFVKKSILNFKHVFVEKPLCLNLSELEELRTLYSEHRKKLIMVGFNRRFSPLILEMKKLLKNISNPKNIIINVNAGHIDSSHWVKDLDIGGGRILSEVCHFIDLATYLAESEIVEYYKIKSPANNEDIFTFTIKFLDNSLANIHYYSNGHPLKSKEVIEVSAGGKQLILENFIKLKGYGFTNFKSKRLFRQNKGHKEMINSFINSILYTGKPTISFDEIYSVSKTTIELANFEKKIY